MGRYFSPHLVNLYSIETLDRDLIHRDQNCDGIGTFDEQYPYSVACRICSASANTQQ